MSERERNERERERTLNEWTSGSKQDNGMEKVEGNTKMNEVVSSFLCLMLGF